MSTIRIPVAVADDGRWACAAHAQWRPAMDAAVDATRAVADALAADPTARQGQVIRIVWAEVADGGGWWDRLWGRE